MILFPAVDIKGGQAVRLRRGRADDSTVFSDDPVAAALQWQGQGAKFLHLVDLDGAFEGVSPNTDLVRRICEALSIPVQLGGGIRDEETAHRWLDAGVARLIIGTLALEDPARFAALCHACPGRIGVSLDAENGRLKTRGWVGDTPYTVDDVVPRLAEDGAAFLVYTDIERDGMQTGVNVPALTHLARTSKVPVIAAGGIADGRGMAAAFMLGAKGIQMGTVFAASKESVIHENYKNSILKAKDIDSRVTGRSTGHPIRVLRNDMARKYLELEKSGAPFEELEQLTLGSLRKAVQEGDTKNGSLMAGQIAGMIKEERTCADIISSTVSEACKLMNGVSANE